MIPADEKEMLARLRSTGEQSHRPDEALADEKLLARARAWLARILVDMSSLMAHTDWLCKAYQTTFRPPLPRRLLDGLEPRRPEPDSRFAYHTRLSESRVAQILKEGVAGLPADEIAPVLLNPYALWDLADRIDVEMPDHWLQLLKEAGKEMMQESGMEIRIPGVDC
jgi:hypothetical protein